MMRHENETNDNLLIELDEIILTGTEKVDKKRLQELRQVRIDRTQIKSIVDLFYQTQAARISRENQIRAIEQGADESNKNSLDILYWDLRNVATQEKELFKVLDAITDKHPVGVWLKKIKGIGPTIAAGILAYFDITRAKYASNFISYAGLNDNNRPWLGREKAAAIVASVVGKDQYITDDHLCKISAKAQWKVEALEDACTIRDEEGNPEYYIDSKKFLELCCKRLGVTTKDISAVIGGARTITLAHAKQIGEHFNKWDVVSKCFDECAVTDDEGFLIPKRDKEKLIGQVAKIPYNKNLKTLLFKVSESFVKVSGKDDSLYGKLFKEFKAEEIRKNEAGELADQAAEILESKNFSKSTEAYKAYSEGRLPDAHINARAKRKVQKIFVSHIFEAMWWDHYGTKPPVPYVFGEMGHNDYIGPEIPFPKKSK